MNGTVPTLVVPMLETVGSGVDSRYRSLRDTISICDFLDEARGARSTRTVSDKPGPALKPATIEGKATSDIIISLVHMPSVDPNFLNVAARSPSELREHAASTQGQMIDDRRTALMSHIAEAKKLAEDAPSQQSESGGMTHEQKLVAFLEEKALANQLLWDVYNGKAGEEKEKEFYAASIKAWEEHVPTVLAQIENVMKGLFTLGDQVSLADLHLIAWLARLVHLSGGSKEVAGIEKLETIMGGKKVGPKLKAFWAAWLERDSFKRL